MEGYRRAAENARKGVAILCIQGKLTREGHAMSMTANKVLINNSSRKLISVSPITSGRLLLSSIALIFIIARIAEPKVFERFDIVSVALLSLFVLPWVSQYFSKISIPGVIEAEIRQLRDDVSETKENVENTRELAFKIENKTDELFMESRGKLLAKSGSIEGLTALANKYVDVRKSMTSGSERTTQMTVIFQKMVKEAEVLDVENEVIENWLTLSDPGKNLAAIAFFYAFPERANITLLLDVAKFSKQPFVQYWSLMVLHKTLQKTQVPEFSASDIETIRNLTRLFRRSTDRHFVARSINQTLDELLGHDGKNADYV